MRNKNHLCKKTAITMFIVIFSLCVKVNAQNMSGTHYGEQEDYRRGSSLCLIMLTHKGTKYAEEMQYQFQQMPLPNRYNDHNVSIRVINVDKYMNANKVAKLLTDNGIAKDLINKWFDRDLSTGKMDMNLIHQRGGFNATFADLKRIENTERGVARLSDEGVELIKNTFVLVCDIDYYDRANTGSFLSGLLTIGAVVLQANAQEQERKGHTDAAVYSQLTSSLATTGDAVASDIGGFAVNLNAYLFRLKWDKSTCDKIYNEYWIDEETIVEYLQQGLQPYKRRWKII